MAINNLSQAANSLTKMLKNKYHIKINSKVVLEMLKIVQANETKIDKYLVDFSSKNKDFFEKHFHEITRMLKDGKGSYAIHSNFLNLSKAPSLGSFKKLIKKINEVQNGKSKR